MRELYKKHRPKEFAELRGQDDAVEALEAMEKDGFPHAIMLTGPSGCGKTSIARIIRSKVGCGKSDFQLVNASKNRGIDDIRAIEERMSLAAFGDARMWFFDEMQGMLPVAQQALLVMLEDCPDHVWFLLATTDPAKVIRTIHNRCTQIKLNPLPAKSLLFLLRDVARKENINLSDKLADKIEEVSEGSARKALVLLEQTTRMKDEKSKLAIVQKAEAEQEAIQIARALINPRSKWSEVGSLLKEIKEEPESIRRMILGYARKIVLDGSRLANRAYLLICAFESNFYDSGQAGLARACWEIYRNKEE